MGDVHEFSPIHVHRIQLIHDRFDLQLTAAQWLGEEVMPVLGSEDTV